MVRCFGLELAWLVSYLTQGPVRWLAFLNQVLWKKGRQFFFSKIFINQFVSPYKSFSFPFQKTLWNILRISNFWGGVWIFYRIYEFKILFWNITNYRIHSDLNMFLYIFCTKYTSPHEDRRKFWKISILVGSFNLQFSSFLNYRKQAWRRDWEGTLPIPSNR